MVKVYTFDEICESQDFNHEEEFTLKSDFDKLATPLKAWVEWERLQVKKYGPYVGKEINELIKNAELVLAEMGIEG